MMEDNDKIVLMMKSRIWPVCSSWQRVTCDAGSSCGRQPGTRFAPSRACPWSLQWLSSRWWWWFCDNDVPEDYTDYHLNYGDGDGDDYWNDDDGDKWKVLCWLSSYCPLLSETFPQQCLWCWTMWVVMSPCWHWVWSWWWTHQAHYQPRTSFPFMVIEYLRDPPYHVCSEQHWPLMNIPIKWNITRISSFRRNLASCQKSFPFQINIKKRYYVDQLSAHCC